MDNPERDIDFSKIKVVPVFDYHSLSEVETVLSRCHPLGYKKALGRRMTYVAKYKGSWIAVLLFDSAVKRNKHREARIGWRGEQIDRGLKHIANNSRFLVSKEYQGVKNVASKVLSLATERISDDWMKHYGVPLLVVETYVDPEHMNNQGTCYIAAGWEKLGFSTGYQPYNEERTHSKWYFLKGLHKESYNALSSEIPHALVTGVKNVSGESNNNYVLDASKVNIKELREELKKIKDPRSHYGKRYEFVPLLAACICAAISGHTQYRQIADWIKRLPVEERIKFGFRGVRTPTENTIGYFISRIDPQQLQTVLSGWLMKTYGQRFKVNTLTIDGKALRGTSCIAEEQKGFLNIFANELGIVIDQIPTQKGGGEKNAMNEFLKSDSNIEGKIILADALHTDRTIIENIVKKKVRISSLSKIIKSM